jgi:hypothetical protein
LKLWTEAELGERIVTHCRQCKQEIIVAERRDGEIYGEYVGKGQLCFVYSFARKCYFGRLWIRRDTGRPRFGKSFIEPLVRAKF